MRKNQLLDSPPILMPQLEPGVKCSNTPSLILGQGQHQNLVQVEVSGEQLLPVPGLLVEDHAGDGVVLLLLLHLTHVDLVQVPGDGDPGTTHQVTAPVS